ncbi:MAG: S1 RNA-binding domain-containing protein, partial [Phycisphaerales bacterium]|nr:S1 RNA-binding domain-containing protein [Phycisphaerales bacterium]
MAEETGQVAQVAPAKKGAGASAAARANGAAEDSFEALFAASERSIKEDEIVEGHVLQILKDHVLVDVGHKSEGLIPIDEFRTRDGGLTVGEGDTVEVYFEAAEDDDGMIVLSKEKADQLRVWDRISDAYDKGEPVSGTIRQRIKGGLRVDIGVPAFLPGSQVDLRPVRNLDDEIGKTYEFKVLKFNKRRGNIVVSRRALLESEREAHRAKTLEVIEEGKTMDGVVKNIT